MAKVKKTRALPKQTRLKKSLTGIQGLDEITEGGLPQWRNTLICGSAGSGKTLMSMQFLVNGARDYDEPGIFISFEENEEELTENMASMGFDLEKLVKKKKLAIDYIHLEPSEVEETGEYELGGLFIRIEAAMQLVGAKRIVIDSIDALFSGLQNEKIIRAELRRLLRWFKDQGLTAIVTAEKGQEMITRLGIEEYVADCVIVLDLRVTEQLATRRMRIIKYRGSNYAANEYPFIFSEDGMSILPLSSIRLETKASSQRISTGIVSLDKMMGGKGYFRGSSILVSGTAGTGKTSILMHFVAGACSRGERCLYLACEESAAQIIRNAKSIGIDLAKWERQGLLRFQAVRPSNLTMEAHLVNIHKTVIEYGPRVVVFDPISSMISIGSSVELHSMLNRLIDFFKARNITNICTNLTKSEEMEHDTDVGISSVMDTWLLLSNFAYGGERSKILSIIKSRGMAHSNQVREFIITSKGIDLVEVYEGGGVVLTGAARAIQEMKEKEESELNKQETRRIGREIERIREIADAKVTALNTELESREEELKVLLQQRKMGDKTMTSDRQTMKDIRTGKS